MFARSGEDWSQEAYLKASTPDVGRWFGADISLSNDTLVVGAPYEDSSATGVDGDPANDDSINSGAAYVFVRSDAGWSQQGYLKASNSETRDEFGERVAVSGNWIAVSSVNEASDATSVNGDQDNNASFSSGAVYLYSREDGTWSQAAYIKGETNGPADWFGSSVSLSGTLLAVSAPGEDGSGNLVDGVADDGALQSGAVFIHRLAP